MQVENSDENPSVCSTKKNYMHSFYVLAHELVAFYKLHAITEYAELRTNSASIIATRKAKHSEKSLWKHVLLYQ